MLQQFISIIFKNPGRNGLLSALGIGLIVGLVGLFKWKRFKAGSETVVPSTIHSAIHSNKQTPFIRALELMGGIVAVIILSVWVISKPPENPVREWLIIAGILILATIVSVSLMVWAARNDE